AGHRISVTAGESRPAQAIRTWSGHGFGSSPPDNCPRSDRSPMVVGNCAGSAQILGIFSVRTKKNGLPSPASH
ncbi:MAG: hypothetical protein KDH18_03380, partial [Rhodoferax sp.]|nr:hypothetical protein [Rhodoferax sp.]